VLSVISGDVGKQQVLRLCRILRFANDLASLGMTIRCKGVGGGQVLGDRAEARFL